MGKGADYSLVDVVADVFSGVDNAIGAIKDAANAVVDGIKAGIQYIANAVLGPLVDGFVTMFRSFIQTSGLIMQHMLDDDININLLTNGLTIGSQSFEISRNNLDVILVFNDQKISISNIFFLSFGKHETLSLGSDAANKVAFTNLIGFVGLLTMVIAEAQVNRLPLNVDKILDKAGQIAFTTSVIHLILQSILATSFQPDDKNDYFENLKSFFLFGAVGFIVSIMIDRWINPIGLKQGVVIGIIELLLGVAVPVVIVGELVDLNLWAFSLGMGYTVLSTILGAAATTTAVPQAAMATNIMLAFYCIIAYMLLAWMQTW